MYDDGDDMDKLCAMDPFLFRINFSKRELVAGVIDAYANGNQKWSEKSETFVIRLIIVKLFNIGRGSSTLVRIDKI